MAPPDLRQARLPRGFVDRGPAEIRGVERMLRSIRETYELYGFEPVETPLVEFSDALGRFLPDQDRPNEGVFSFQDDPGPSAAADAPKDNEWLSLRYDLTAPLARHYAENHERLPKPYRSYRAGWVFRNEKPGPGRFRQFMQFDADTVGSASVAADAEMCMMMADTLERLGIPRGQYVIRVNNRKVLDGVLEAIGLGGDENAARRLTVLRSIDKLDRLGAEEVRKLLGAGREDESGAFWKGAGLDEEQTTRLLQRLTFDAGDVIGGLLLQSVGAGVGERPAGEKTEEEGLEELARIQELVRGSGYGSDRIKIDPSVVRGLEYYTGPVYEADLTFQVTNDDGLPVRFGSVGGGGRYDGLVGRFLKENVPATGFSIGVSRLAAALKSLGKLTDEDDRGPVVVLVMDRAEVADYQAIVAELRNAGIRAEFYLGSSGMKAQMKYADRRGSPVAVIVGSDERAAGTVTLKDLALGTILSSGVASHEEWRASRPAQVTVPRGDLVAEVRRMLGGGS